RRRRLAVNGRVPHAERAGRVVLPDPGVQRVERREAEAVASRVQHERLAEQRRRRRMGRVPGGLEDDVLQRDQAHVAARVDLVDQRLGPGRVERAGLDERALDEVDAHRAGAGLVDAGQPGRVGQQLVPGGGRGRWVVVDGRRLARVGGGVRRGADWQRRRRQDQRRGRGGDGVLGEHRWFLSGGLAVVGVGCSHWTTDRIDSPARVGPRPGKTRSPARNIGGAARLAWPRTAYGQSAGAQRDGDASAPDRSTHAAIWARERAPSLPRMFSTCRSTVRSLMTSSAPIWRLVSPSATSAATSHSRAVSGPAPDGVGGGRLAGAGPAALGALRAYPTAASSGMDRPVDHISANAASPSASRAETPTSSAAARSAGGGATPVASPSPAAAPRSVAARALSPRAWAVSASLKSKNVMFHASSWRRNTSRLRWKSSSAARVSPRCCAILPRTRSELPMPQLSFSDCRISRLSEHSRLARSTSPRPINDSDSWKRHQDTPASSSMLLNSPSASSYRRHARSYSPPLWARMPRLTSCSAMPHVS